MPILVPRAAHVAIDVAPPMGTRRASVVLPRRLITIRKKVTLFTVSLGTRVQGIEVPPFLPVLSRFLLLLILLVLYGLRLSSLYSRGSFPYNPSCFVWPLPCVSV